ncbi:MAG: PAS domain S-box protein [Planctomycetes bacterium]|nr:PAS domain S-box protein [Planctomycetota bacterium]
MDAPKTTYVQLQAENARLRALLGPAQQQFESDLRLALREADLVFWTWDIPSGRTETFGAWHDLTVSDLAACLRRVHDDDRAAVEQQLGPVLRGEASSYALRHRLVLDDGTVLWVDSRGRAILGPDGTVERVVCTTRDVSARREAEIAARTSQEGLAAIIEHAPSIAIQTYDQDGRILSWNRASTAIFGFSAEQAIGRRIEEVMLSEQEAATFRATLAAIAADGKTRGPCEYPVIRRDGTAATVLSSAFALPSAQGRLFVCMDIDITERKRADEQVLQAARIESIGRLAGGVAHDFNNILTAILGWSDIAERGIAATSPTHRALSQLRVAAERGAKLTAQLLAFARKQVLLPCCFGVDAAVAKILELLRPLIGEDIQLQSALAAPTAAVRMDPGQFEQVVVNLSVNARDAMAGGGTLTVATGIVIGDDSDPRIPRGPWASITVDDTGDGMSAELQARIFEPFFTTKGEGKGTGLGLATSLTIVLGAGGSIFVDSHVGNGSTFTVLLPLVGIEPSSVVPAAPLPAARTGNETILLVEDEEAIRELAAQWLVDHGYRVLSASDGEEALAVAQGTPRIDALITDVIMPHIGGLELALLLTGMRPNLCVLYTSGYIDRGYDVNDLASAGSDFLQKPYQLRELGERLRRLLDRKSVTTPGS